MSERALAFVDEWVNDHVHAQDASGDIEAHATSIFAIELQRRVGLEEVVMRADLDRTVAGIGDGDLHRLAASIELDLAALDEELARDHLALLSDRLVHSDKLGAIRECCFNLNFRNHFGYAGHHLRSRNHMRAFLHELGHCAAVAGAFENVIADERDGFRVVELDTAFESASRHHCRHGDQKLILFARCKIHRSPFAKVLSSTRVAEAAFCRMRSKRQSDRDAARRRRAR